MLNVLLSGGILIVPLVVCLILALAIVCERFFVLRHRSLIPESRMDYLCETVSRPTALQNLTQTYDGNPLQRLLIVGIQNENESKQHLRQAIAHESEYIAHDLERFLNLLGSIAIISPLIGLLGTVLGMIEVFEAVLAQGTGVAPALAGGISQALVTTAFGMAVAIPSVFFSRVFYRRIDGLLIDLESKTTSLLEQYRSP